MGIKSFTYRLTLWVWMFVSDVSALDYTQFWEPMAITNNINPYQAGVLMPGNKYNVGYGKIFPHVALPGQQREDFDPFTYFKPFNSEFGLNILYDAADSWGVGTHVAPTNPHKMNMAQVYPVIASNGGNIPNFHSNPMLGSFDPFGTGFTTGVAWEKRNHNWGSSLTFTAPKHDNDFELGGGWSRRPGFYSGGIGIPLLNEGMQLPVTGHFNHGGHDKNTQFGYSVANTNGLKIPIAEMYPALLTGATGGQVTFGEPIPPGESGEPGTGAPAWCAPGGPGCLPVVQTSSVRRKAPTPPMVLTRQEGPAPPSEITGTDAGRSSQSKPAGLPSKPTTHPEPMKPTSFAKLNDNLIRQSGVSRIGEKSRIQSRVSNIARVTINPPREIKARLPPAPHRSGKKERPKYVLWTDDQGRRRSTRVESGSTKRQMRKKLRKGAAPYIVRRQ